MFNLGSNQPTSSRMNFAATGVGALDVGNRHRHIRRWGTAVRCVRADDGFDWRSWDVAGLHSQRKPGSR